jgi:hypothetical protein
MYIKYLSFNVWWTCSLLLQARDKKWNRNFNQFIFMVAYIVKSLNHVLS